VVVEDLSLQIEGQDLERLVDLVGTVRGVALVGLDLADQDLVDLESVGLGLVKIDLAG